MSVTIMNRYDIHNFNRDTLKYYPGKRLADKTDSDIRITLVKKNVSDIDGRVLWLVQLSWPEGQIVSYSQSRLDSQYEPI